MFTHGKDPLTQDAHTLPSERPDTGAKLCCCAKKYPGFFWFDKLGLSSKRRSLDWMSFISEQQGAKPGVFPGRDRLQTYESPHDTAGKADFE